MRSTHAYYLTGIGKPRTMLLSVYMSIDGVGRHVGAQAARELAEDLVLAADSADRAKAEVRSSLLGRS